MTDVLYSLSRTISVAMQIYFGLIQLEYTLVKMFAQRFLVVYQ